MSLKIDIRREHLLFPAYLYDNAYLYFSIFTMFAQEHQNISLKIVNATYINIPDLPTLTQYCIVSLKTN